MDSDAMVRAVARWLPVERLPELIVEDMLADTIDVSCASEQTRSRLFAKHARVELAEGLCETRFFDYLHVSHLGGEIWYRITHGKHMWHRGGDNPACVMNVPWCAICKEPHHGAKMYWFVNGRLHREGGQPAAICELKSQWYLKGQLVDHYNIRWLTNGSP